LQPDNVLAALGQKRIADLMRKKLYNELLLYRILKKGRGADERG
jgi:hypothetical protein